jgi:hypothetical protein
MRKNRNLFVFFEKQLFHKQWVLITGVVSQLVEAYARRKRNDANNAWLARAG